MAELSLWIQKSPDTPPVKLVIEDSIPESKLKADILSQLNLSGVRQDGRTTSYQIICLRTGWVLGDGTIPVSSLFRDGDSFMIKQTLSTTRSNSVDYIHQSSEDIMGLKKINGKRINPLETNFSITGIKPFSLDLSAEYPVLAVNIRYTHTGEAKIRSKPGWSRTNNLWPGVKPIYVKDTSFLIADREGKFRFESSTESNFYLPELSGAYPLRDKKQITRYSMNDDIGECKNMIYPIRPFSITQIKLEGFSPEKIYPVLAIDMDQYFSEDQEKEETESVNEQSQFMAFFLVGDDNGEFAWIAEDECRLAPL